MARRACAVLAIALAACGRAREPSSRPASAPAGAGAIAATSAGGATPGGAGRAGPGTTGSAGSAGPSTTGSAGSAGPTTADGAGSAGPTTTGGGSAGPTTTGSAGPTTTGSAGSAGPTATGSAGSAGPTATGSASTTAGAAQAGDGCALLPFAISTPVPEASGAAWVTLDGKRVLVIVGDSGNHGAYGVIDPDTGATGETGQLPLGDGTNDDLEGLAARGDRLYGLSSSGWIRVWQRRGAGFALIDGPYPLGPIDLPDRKSHARPPDGNGMVCSGRTVNCGRDYEGLCLAPVSAARGACVGFAASKADGQLYCLTEQAGRLAVHREPAIAVSRPGALSDCAFAEDGELWAGSNLLDLGRVFRVVGWQDTARARVELVGALPIGFPELIAARGDIVYRMSDMGGAPSLMAKFRCPR